jgi:hypothetical protein
VKALITPFLCLCVLPALASPLICTQGNGAPQQALRDRCPSADASFVNSAASNPDQAGTDTTAPIDMIGPLFSGLNYQVVMNLGPLTDAQMKSLFGKDASGNADPTTTAQLSSPGAGTSAASNSTATSAPAATSAVSMPVGFGMDPPPPGGSVSPAGSASLVVPAPNVTDPVAAAVTAAAATTAAVATPEAGSIAMIGSGLVFLSLVASSTRKRKRVRG